MKLTAFRIRNFRSIVDSGWQNLSPDNITCLIGQNESGKTSVLEALRDFHSGLISEDVLRSDLSLPEVSCRFAVPEGWLVEHTDNPGPELRELLVNLTHVELTRKWIADLSSVVHVSGEISSYLNSLEDAWKLYLSNVIESLTEEMKAISVLESELFHIENKVHELRAATGGIKLRSIRFLVKRDKQKESADELTAATSEKQLLALRKEKEQKLEALERKKAIKDAGEKWARLNDNYQSALQRNSELTKKLEERHQKLTLLMPDSYENSDQQWTIVLDDFKRSQNECEARLAELEQHIAVTGYLIGGLSEEDSLEKASEAIRSYKSGYNIYVLGARYFELSPVFELFEDFGSLLPNRIDLDDIISGNDQVEGYKAARNFLSLARLDYYFFQQPSSRILKQTIENLNKTLTGNFHEFWQQKIGRSNKIHIQFELEHYNSSFGQKAGKPYLEFWIKDEGERLYPKQRSRGVRWFLSFYMELKASANLKDNQLILLVDEPGVSLHARAQEDVLKVFEDIRDRIQIIYTTHSPHLVEVTKLHRVLAVQRDDMDNLRSATRIIDPLKLSTATSDTLTPLQSFMGIPFTTEGISGKKLNLIVSDSGTFYLLSAVLILGGYRGKVNMIPSVNLSTIPVLCNIIMGWGMDFAVLLFNNTEENRLAEELKLTIFRTEGSHELIIKMPPEYQNAEDLISTLDFKHHFLETREGITVPNSVFVKENAIARNFILSTFLSKVKAGTVSLEDLDEESSANIKTVIEIISALK
ncbi:MAG TPA: AAA family ATPase [Bacteroidales bacterium]|nr:AAA family ATPase [Bacteroidales bacterium]